MRLITVPSMGSWLLSIKVAAFFRSLPIMFMCNFVWGPRRLMHILYQYGITLTVSKQLDIFRPVFK